MTSQETPDAVSPEAALTATVNRNAVMVAVSVHRLGTTRAVKSTRVRVTDQTETGVDVTDPTLLHVSKKLVDCEEYTAITKHDTEFYAVMQRHVIQAKYRRGVYLLPVRLLPWFEREFKAYAQKRGELVEAFCAVYAERIDEARTRLSTLFDEGDYPSVGAVRDAFFVEKGYESAAVPERLKELDPALYEQELARMRGAMDQTAEEVRSTLRTALLQLVRRLESRLRPGEDGKKQRLHESAVSGLQEWLGLFEARNVANDAELAQVVARLRPVVAGAEIDEFRKDAAFRTRALAALEAAGNELEKLVDVLTP